MKRLFAVRLWFLVAVAAALAALVTNTLPASANLLSNGSFEVSPLSPSWTVGGNGVNQVSGWNAKDLTNLVDLNAESGPGSISQTLSTVPGGVYTVSFWLSGNPQCGIGTTKTMTASAGNASITRSHTVPAGTPTNGSALTWTQETFNFTALGTSAVLSFVSNTTDLSCGPLIDLVDVSFVSAPPSLGGLGNTVTYNEDAVPVVVAPGLAVGGTLNIDGAKVSIGANFNAAQDSLGVNGALPAGISSSYNPAIGVLSLTGTGSPSDYQQALRQVVYSNNSQNPATAPRTVTFNIGSQLAFTGNGHFYEFVAGYITWSNAHSGAQSKTLYGLQGYLATITSASENTFIKDKLQGNGWLGGSDAATEGTWKWVTGPEAGTTFCIGTGNCVPQGGAYTNWDGGEPNEAGPEDHVHMLGNPGFGANVGRWNDLNENYPQNGGLYQPLGYVVEYGGSAGDPALQLSGDVTVNVVAVNDPPTVAANAPSVTVNEGQTANNSGTFGDIDSANVAISASRGTVTKSGAANGTWSWSLGTVDGPSETGSVTITANDANGGVTFIDFQLNVDNVAPGLTVNAGSNAVYYVDWTAASPAGGTASGVITLPGGNTVSVTFEARKADGTLGFFYAPGTQTGCGTNYWNPTTPYISAEVPSAPPNCEILALSGTPGMTYKVTLGEPIVNPIMAILSLGSGGTTASYDFDSPFTIVSQGVGFWGGCATCLVPLPGDVLRGNEGHGTLKFLGTYTTFSWTVPLPETWHGFTFAIRNTLALGNTDVAEGETATNTGTWSDPGVNDNVALSASIGTVVKNADGTWNWSFVTTDGPPQTQPVTITATDKDGASTSQQFQLKVNNVAPTITSVTNNGPAGTGSPVTVTLTATDPAGAADPLQYEFDFDNNGSYEVGPQAGNSAQHAYPTLGTKTVNVRVTDGDGGSATGSTQVQVTNTPPTVKATPGGTFTVPGTSNNFSTGITLSGNTVSITASGAWTCLGPVGSSPCQTGPNGTGNPGSSAFLAPGLSEFGLIAKVGSGPWRFVGAGPTTITGTGALVLAMNDTFWNDNQGSMSVIVSPISVADEGGTSVMDGVYNDIDAGQNVSISAPVGTVTKTGTNSGTWSWSNSAPDGPASYTVTITANDGNGGVATTTFAVTVNNVAPTITAVFQVAPIPEGSISVSGNIVAQATDPAGSNDPLTFTFDCDNNGIYETPANPNTSAADCFFDDNGNYTVGVRVSDGDGGVATGSTVAVVTNLAPTAFLPNSPSINEGSSVTFTFENQLDPSNADTVAGFRYSFACDGSVASLATSYAGAGTSDNVSCIYLDNGTYTVAGRIFDKNNGYNTYTASVVVLNVAPTVTATGDTIDENGVATVSGTITDPGVLDTFTVVIDWGEGSPESYSYPAGSTSYSETHQYLDDNPTATASDNYNVNVKVTDDDTGSGSASTSVTVNNLKPVASVVSVTPQPQYWGLNVAFDGAHTDVGTQDTHTASWIFGDAGTANGFDVGHVYQYAGSYTATITVIDDDTGIGTASTTVTIVKRPSALAYTGDTTTTFGFQSTLSAQFSDLVDAGTDRLSGRTIVFTVDGTLTYSATTDGNGVASTVIQPFPPLMPGAHAIAVSFTEDGDYLASSTSATLTIVNTVGGKITAGTLKAPNKGRGGFNVQSTDGAAVKGELEFQNNSINYHAHVMTAVGVSPDHTKGWFAGIGTDGSTFVAYVEDNGEPGTSDVFKLWVNGIPVNGNGALTGGNVQIHK